MKKIKQLEIFGLVLCVLGLILLYLLPIYKQQIYKEDVKTNKGNSTTFKNFNYDEVPEFDGINATYILNNNIPYFDISKFQNDSFEYYSGFDELGRCGNCIACIGSELMPKTQREDISEIKPTGWHSVKYEDVIEDGYLYNRCHLIAYQLTGENANQLNLITGTRYMNIEGMLPYESKIYFYLTDNKDNHVLYSATPIFINNELVCRGVVLEGYSLEDNGKGICFNVFCYNVQPGILIDYLTGESEESKYE